MTLIQEGGPPADGERSQFQALAQGHLVGQGKTMLPLPASHPKCPACRVFTALADRSFVTVSLGSFVFKGQNHASIHVKASLMVASTLPGLPSKEKLSASNPAIPRVLHTVRSEARRVPSKVCILHGMSALARSQRSWISPKESFALTLDNCQHVS